MKENVKKYVGGNKIKNLEENKTEASTSKFHNID